MAAKRTKIQSNRRNIVTPLSQSREIVLVDDGPLRKKLWRLYQQAVGRFEKLSAELREFKEIDAEQYRLWYEREFSTEVLHLRRTQSAVADLAEWLDQIHTFASMRSLTTAASFAILTQAKAEDRLEELWQDLTKEREDETRASSSGRVDEETWKDLEDSFRGIFAEAEAEAETRSAPQPAVDRTAEKSLREMFHQLAFRLHPDTNPDQTAEDRQLFHAVQEAYRDQDIETLESLWKKVQGKGEGPFSWKTAAVSAIISRRRDIDRRNRDINTELKFAKQHPGWKFSQILQNKASLSVLRQKIKLTLKSELKEFEAEWEELNELLVQLEKRRRR